MIDCYPPKKSDALTFIRQLIFLVFIAAPAGELWAGLRISEFVASNGSGLGDEDGDYADWIEIENTEIGAQSIGGYFYLMTLTTFSVGGSPTGWSWTGVVFC